MLKDTSESLILQAVNIGLDFFVAGWLLYIQNLIMDDQNILLAKHSLQVQ